MIEQNQDINHNLPESETLLQVEGHIELQNIWFRYPSRKQIVFQYFYLSIHAGKTITPVGHNGFGKSTIISIFKRFYDPYAGHFQPSPINENISQ